MPLPGPVAVARRLFGALVGRPLEALRPFLAESYPAEPTLFDEVMTLVAGAGSFAIVSFGFLCFVFGSTAYATVYPVVVRILSLVGWLRSRLGR